MCVSIYIVNIPLETCTPRDFKECLLHALFVLPALFSIIAVITIENWTLLELSSLVVVFTVCKGQAKMNFHF